MTLAAKLEALYQGAKERIPVPVLEKMAQATEELRQSGIAEKALQTGAVIPQLSLPDETGKVVTSEELLVKGPLVLTFYRGSW